MFRRLVAFVVAFDPSLRNGVSFGAVDGATTRVDRQGRRDMGGNAQQRPSEPDRPLSKRAIVLCGVLLGVVGAVAFAALRYFYGGGTDQDRAGLDVVRTAGTLVVGAGGAIALLLAARRQRSTELTLEHQRLTLEHQREVATTAAQDAVEQRITELYTRAVDQLGNGQAPVRLGGLHALERLAQNNPAQRQTIVDVICAYLRMPYLLPNDNPPDEDAPADAHTRHEQRRQELQVRLTAQRILTAHLRADAGIFWPGIDLDLTEAQLHRFDLTNCHIRNAQFGKAQFSGDTRFRKAQFAGDVWFVEVQFSGNVWFNDVQFFQNAWFDLAHFSGDAEFVAAHFSQIAGFSKVQFFENAWFNSAQFSRYAWFAAAHFSGDAMFHEAHFSWDAMFGEAQFSGHAGFSKAQFYGKAIFDSAQFSGNTSFVSARARPAENDAHVWPASWTTREAGEDEEDGWLYLTSKGR